MYGVTANIGEQDIKHKPDGCHGETIEARHRSFEVLYQLGKGGEDFLKPAVKACRDPL